MSQRLQSVLGLLLILLTVVACSSQPERPPLPEQNTGLIYPPMPPTKCRRAPIPPAIDASDNEWAAYKKDRDDAGDDCRDKLDAVDAVISKWPSRDADQIQK